MKMQLNRLSIFAMSATSLLLTGCNAAGMTDSIAGSATAPPQTTINVQGEALHVAALYRTARAPTALGMPYAHDLSPP